MDSSSENDLNDAKNGTKGFATNNDIIFLSIGLVILGLFLIGLVIINPNMIFKFN